MTEVWGLVQLNEIASLETQTVWHAAALTRQETKYDNILLIDWPNRPFVSVGYHQDPKIEVDLAACEQRGYEVYRRACGGGQVFLDGNQIFYHMITDPKNPNLRGRTLDFYQKLLQPVVSTYQNLGINARFAPINDIVAEGKKISGNGAATLGDSRILTGNFILSFPSSEMAQVLRVPDEKFRDKVAKSLEDRVGSFHSLLGTIPDTATLITTFLDNFGSILDIEFERISLPPSVKDKMGELNTTYKTDAWKYAISGRSAALRAVKIKGGMFVSESMIKTPGGLIRGVYVTEDNVITYEPSLSGDITVEPVEGLSILEKDLKGVHVEENELKNIIQKTTKSFDMPGVTTDHLVDLTMKAASSHKEARV
ncbi:MAG: biotin/lipoate A/B protein ligase family protein [Candidatus Heimdallarchaeota archaeon]